VGEGNSTMNPYWKNNAITLYCGDCREVLRELPENSVHCVITSPPGEADSEDIAPFLEGIDLGDINASVRDIEPTTIIYNPIPS